MNRRLLLGLGAGLLGGCGFRPLYGSAGDEPGVQARLAEIHVQLIPERSGQLLRQALQARLHRGGDGVARRYDLAVQLAVAGEPIAIQPDNSPSRVRLIGTATWVLSTQGGQRRTITSGTARDVDGYNIINQQFFAAELTNAAVQRRMTESLADQITVQLAAFFARSAAG